MRLSDKLLMAFEADRLYNNCDTLDFELQHPYITKFYQELRRLEDNPTMKNYDFWGLKRPEGLHSLGSKIDL